MADDVAAAVEALTDLVSRPSIERLQHAGGAAAKEASLDEAARDLGADRAFSGFRRRNARLGAGYDVEPDATYINLRPKGLWVLANTGRRAGNQRIAPRKRGGAKALKTPWGPRASVKPSNWRGFGTLKRAEDRFDTEVPEAVEREMFDIVSELF